MSLQVLGRTVSRAGQVVACLTFSGPVVWIHDRLGDEVLGRLMKTPGSSPAAYDVWTVLHQAGPVPSDKILDHDLDLVAAVEAALSHHARKGDPR